MVDPVKPLVIQSEHEFRPDDSRGGNRFHRNENSFFREGTDIPVEGHGIADTFSECQNPQIGCRLVVDFVFQKHAFLFVKLVPDIF